MKELLNTYFLSNSIYSWLWVLGIIAFAILFGRLISTLLIRLINKLFAQQWTADNKTEMQRRIIRPMYRLMVATVSALALERLSFPEELKFSVFGNHSWIFIPKFGLLIILITFFGLLLGIVNYVSWRMGQKAITTPSSSDDQLIYFLKSLLRVFVVSVAILTILQLVFDKDIRALLQGLTIIGAAIALAAKESLENLIASFIIFFDKPFYAGDFVKVNNVQGTVERIGLRSTRLRTADKTLITIPNKQMVDSIVDNVSMRKQMRNVITLEFDAVTPAGELEQFMEKSRVILKENEEIENFSVFFKTFSKNASEVVIEYFTGTMPLNDSLAIRQSLNLRLKGIADEMDIKFAGASTTISIANPQPGNSAAPPQNSII